jgi:predicted kinase
LSKPTCYITQGLPASGKTTWAKNLGIVRLSLDDIRSIMGYRRERWTKQQEQVAIDTMIAAAKATVENGDDVVLDNTFLAPRLPKLIFTKLEGKANFKVKSFLDEVSMETCIERDSAREWPVGEDVIRKMAKTVSRTTRNWKLTDEWMNQWPDITGYTVADYDSTGLPEVILCDLDGTAALHVSRGPYEALRCDEDAPDETVFGLLVGAKNKGYKIIFLSGREGKPEVKEKTIKWIETYWKGDYTLLMRGDGDPRPDFVVKFELYRDYLFGKFNVKYSLDDRNQVCALWRQLGIKTLQVADGNF